MSSSNWLSVTGADSVRSLPSRAPNGSVDVGCVGAQQRAGVVGLAHAQPHAAAHRVAAEERDPAAVGDVARAGGARACA